MPAPRHDEKTAETMRDVNRKLSEEATQVAQTTAEMSERAARASADMFQRNADIVQETWKMSSSLATRVTQQSADQIARALGLSGEEAKKATQQSTQNFDAIIGSSAVLAEGLESISREWLEFARQRVEHNLARLDALTRVRTPHDFAALQTDAVRDNLESALQSARRTAEISARTVDGAMRKLAEGTRQSA